MGIFKKGKLKEIKFTRVKNWSFITFLLLLCHLNETFKKENEYISFSSQGKEKKLSDPEQTDIYINGSACYLFIGYFLLNVENN